MVSGFHFLPGLNLRGVIASSMILLTGASAVLSVQVQEFTIDAKSTEQHSIGNRFKDISVWHYNGTTEDEKMFHEWAEEMPSGWLNQEYPWLEEVQVFIASGGAYRGHKRQAVDDAGCELDRDLFVDPSNMAIKDDYDFTPLVRACRNMLRLGVKPCLKLHNVPIKYSSSAKIGNFRVNVRPPDDYEIYANYISALVQAMVDAFGKCEVSAWRWYVGTEFDNDDWWLANDNSSESTAREFCKLYDWSVYAVERVLGTDCGPIGSHAMMKNEFWDTEIFFKHCQSGKNYANGKTGTRLDFFAISEYDRSAADLKKVKEFWPEMDGQNNVLGSLNYNKKGTVVDAKGFRDSIVPGSAKLEAFESKVSKTRQILGKYGFGELPIEVSEGGIAYGSDGKWLWTGLAYGSSFDATWTALSYKKMLDEGVHHWARWPVYRTSGLFSGPELAATNTLRLISRMSEDRRIGVERVGGSGMSQVVASLSPDTSAIRVLAFHHAPKVTDPRPTESLDIQLKNLPFSGRVKVTTWRVDGEHANFWPKWEKDRAEHGITDDDYYQSRDQPDPAHALLRADHIAFWRSKEREYSKLSQLSVHSVQYMSVEGNQLDLRVDVPCFGVAFLEVSLD